MFKRKRATIIVKTPKGILLVSNLILGKFMFALPGGGIKFRENPEISTRRELQEETSLVIKKIKFLFNFKGRLHNHFVFEAQVSGVPKKSWETRHFVYYNDKVRIEKTHKKIIEKYLMLNKNN